MNNLSQLSVEKQGTIQTIDPWSLPANPGAGNLMAYYAPPLALGSSATADLNTCGSAGAHPPLPQLNSPGTNSVPSISNGGMTCDDNMPVYGRNIYVASLPEDITDEKLRALFSPFGEIISAKAMPCKDTHRCRGYGFVLFERPEDAARAQVEMIGHVVGGNKIQVRQARPSACQQIISDGGSSRASRRAGAGVQALSCAALATPLPIFSLSTTNSPQYSSVSTSPSTEMARSGYLTTPTTPPGPFIMRQQQPVVYMMVPVAASGNIEPNNYQAF